MALTKVGKEGITGISNSSDATAITIDSSERINIGTGTPPTADSVLTVQKSSAANEFNVISSPSHASVVNLGDTDDYNICRIKADNSDNSLQFQTNNTEAMRIDTNGDLFLGTTSANSAGKIDVEFNGTSRNGIVLKTTRTATGTNFLEFVNSSGSNAGEINHNGSTTVNYSESSDYRLKENVSYNFDATTRLKQLKPARFNFIADGADKIVDGFLAHEVSNIVPEAITGEKDATKEDGSIKAQSIDKSKLVPLLTKTLQEALTRIETLEAEVKALKG
tara:strand:+ start:37 stop:870 length:834 start_codon:yes stop_codon:yes gene_type:complete